MHHPNRTLHAEFTTGFCFVYGLRRCGFSTRENFELHGGVWTQQNYSVLSAMWSNTNVPRTFGWACHCLHSQLGHRLFDSVPYRPSAHLCGFRMRRSDLLSQSKWSHLVHMRTEKSLNIQSILGAHRQIHLIASNTPSGGTVHAPLALSCINFITSPPYFAVLIRNVQVSFMISITWHALTQLNTNRCRKVWVGNPKVKHGNFHPNH